MRKRMDSVERVEPGVQAIVDNRVDWSRVLCPVRRVETIGVDKNMRLVAAVCELTRARLDLVSCETATLAIPQVHAPAWFRA